MEPNVESGAAMSPEGVPAGSQVTAACAAVAVVALAVEAALVAAVGSGTSIRAAVAGHVLLGGALAVHARRARTGRRGAVLLLVGTLAFGPFGPLGVLLLAVLERRHARHATSIEAWHDMLFPPHGVDPRAELWRRIGQRASDRAPESHVTPFLDVLAFGSIPQRQAVIAIIAQQFHPAFASALKAALRDEHNVVRVQAATAIARIEREFLERTVELEEAAAGGDGPAVLALARHYDGQAFAGLLDPAREQACQVSAAERYAAYLASHPADDEARFHLARLAQRRRRWPEAEALLRPLADAGHPRARVWLMENLFAQRRYRELRELAAMPGPHSDDAAPIEVSSAVALWAQKECLA